MRGERDGDQRRAESREAEDERARERDRDEEQSYAEEEGRSSQVHPSRGRNDLSPRAASSESQRCHGRPRRPHGCEHHERDDAQEEDERRQGVSEKADERL